MKIGIIRLDKGGAFDEPSNGVFLVLPPKKVQIQPDWHMVGFLIVSKPVLRWWALSWWSEWPAIPATWTYSKQTVAEGRLVP